MSAWHWPFSTDSDTSLSATTPPKVLVILRNSIKGVVIKNRARKERGPRIKNFAGLRILTPLLKPFAPVLAEVGHIRFVHLKQRVHDLHRGRILLVHNLVHEYLHALVAPTV